MENNNNLDLKEKPNDSVELLQECISGIKMGIASIDEVLEDISDDELKSLLTESKEHHKKLEQDISQILDKYDIEEKNPNPFAKSMSWIKTNFKMGMNDSSATVADLIIDGCDMGIKSLNKYKNKYEKADNTSVDICNRLIQIEDELRKKLIKFL